MGFLPRRSKLKLEIFGSVAHEVVDKTCDSLTLVTMLTVCLLGLFVVNTS